MEASSLRWPVKEFSFAMRPTFTRRQLLQGLSSSVALPKAAFSQDSSKVNAETFFTTNGAALVRLAGLRRHGAAGRLLAQVKVPESSAPVLGPHARSVGHRALWRMVFEGKAAGNHGDLYENRDRGHSMLPPKAHPQLTHIAYDKDARAAGLDYGLAGPVIFEAPVIGNSSTAAKHGPLWRSQPRLALTRDGGSLRLYQNYVAGQIHVYPEHRDHDPEHGDLFPANTPYYLVSQGSSGSDQPHLEALAMILAAFRPSTKAFLKENQLLAPTVQMVFRRSLTSVRSRAAYLSGQAHPSAFAKDQINLVRMVQLANALTPETVPPMVRLSILSETLGIEGVDYFGEGLSERLFDTPSAIARLWRSHQGQHSMVVSAEATRDPHGGRPEFTWCVLRGDPARTKIEPLDERGLRASITVDWQLPRPVPGRPDIRSSRVDIGVFARSGPQDSAPAFISIFLPQHETRRYERSPSGDLRIESLDRGLRKGSYADPVLFPVSAWRDVYSYGGEGALLGWERQNSEGRVQFNAAGQMLTQDGAVSVRHLVERQANGLSQVVAQRVL